MGTTVRVNLPVTRRRRRRPAESRRQASTAANGETVLLVEDEQIVREPTRRMLVRHGYTVLAAANADEAMAIVREHPGADRSAAHRRRDARTLG